MSIYFHGSSTDHIQILEPRRRFVPAGEKSPPEAIYASDLPAFSAAHAFTWSSEEGIDLYVQDKTVVLEVPKKLESRLDQPVFIYEVASKTFERVDHDTCGHTFRSVEPVQCIAKRRFETVTEAITTFKGKVVIKA